MLNHDYLYDYVYDVLVIHWLNSKLNNCEITAKSTSNCVLSETTDFTKNTNGTKIAGKFSTSTPASAESAVWVLKHIHGNNKN